LIYGSEGELIPPERNHSHIASLDDEIPLNLMAGALGSCYNEGKNNGYQCHEFISLNLTNELMSGYSSSDPRTTTKRGLRLGGPGNRCEWTKCSK
jgi:hypothetical protein